MTTTSPMEGIFYRLGEVGISRDYVTSIALPDWWEPEITATPLGLAQTAGFIASKLGLDFASLLNDGPIHRSKHQIAFKKPKNATGKRLEIEGAIAAQAAQIAVEATPGARHSLPATAMEWRGRLLAATGKITFETLLAECWNCGIAVLTLTGDALPTGKRGRPHALAAHFGGRFAIVLMGEKQHQSTPWQAFRLAHEVGHVSLGHLQTGSVICDEKIFANEPDEQEIAADAFAVELLFGTAEMKFRTTGTQWLNAEDLAREMPGCSQKFKVEEGAIALNWARTMNVEDGATHHWATAVAALKKFDATDAHGQVRQMLEANLDWDELAEEQAAFLRRVNGLRAASPFSSHLSEGKFGA